MVVGKGIDTGAGAMRLGGAGSICICMSSTILSWSPMMKMSEHVAWTVFQVDDGPGDVDGA